MNLLKRNFQNYSFVTCTRCKNNYALPNRFKLLCRYHPSLIDMDTKRYPCCRSIENSEGCKRRTHTDLPSDCLHKEKPIEIIEKPSKEYDFYMKHHPDSMLEVRWMSISAKQIKGDIFLKLNSGMSKNVPSHDKDDIEEGWERINAEDYFFKFDEGLPNEVEEGRKVIKVEEDKTEIIEELVKKNPKVCFSYDEILQEESDEENDDTNHKTHDRRVHTQSLLSIDAKFGKNTEFILIAKNDVLLVRTSRTSLRKD